MSSNSRTRATLLWNAGATLAMLNHSEKQQNKKHRNMNSIKQAFSANFEQVPYDKEPEFKIHGIGYQGKWGKDTISMFLNDLQAVEDELRDDQTESIVSWKDEIASLKDRIEDLEEELKEANKRE